MFAPDKKILYLRTFFHLLVFIAFTNMLNEWALGLAVSVFLRCYINKFAEKTYFFFRKVMTNS